MDKSQIYYLFCNHWTQGGIGYAFPSGWYNGKKYERTFSSAYTIHKMLDAADEFPGLKVSMELDAFCYEEVLKEDPACIERLKQYIREGKAGIDGGTYGQPFGQDYGWESNIRQLTYGRKSAQELLEYDVKAFLVEEQWFHPQLPQLLLQSGYQYASLQNQNSGQVKPMNEAIIQWVGLDGSKLPTVPANDLLVSCVRQYTDYSAYKEKLRKYENPLLFQWVEVWVPGMDWGASGTPFAKGIEQMLHEWNGKSVTLGEYLDLEAHNRELKDVYISLDDSNYVNNWYQDGGWGYDGDRVMILDKQTEQKVLALESLSAIHAMKDQHQYPESQLQDIWKKFMVLQNHDFSAARGYRVFSEEGHKTNAGSLAMVEYAKLAANCQVLIGQILDQATKSNESLTLHNPAGFAHQRTMTLELCAAADEQIVLKQEERTLECQELERTDGKVKLLTTVDLPGLGHTTLQVEKQLITEPTSKNTAVNSAQTIIENDHVRVEWISDTWKAKITDKSTGNSVTFAGFTGPIAKVNEHDGGLYAALSSGHEIFSFAFDGATHCPDQLTWPKAEVEESGAVQSTLKIFSNVLTLHTTSTPVAFAETRIRIHHLTGKVECESYFYTGVWLSLQCWAEFTHDMEDVGYYRDFPFGEEETHIDWIYPNTYTRVASASSGFTIVHPGVQRVNIQRSGRGGTVRHLIARDKVLGDYRWKFALHFGKHQSWESAKLAQAEHAYVTAVAGDKGTDSFFSILDPKVMLSALYREADGLVVRLVNYSEDEVEDAQIRLQYRFDSAVITDFMGNEMEKTECVVKDAETWLSLSFKPWQVMTVVLR